MNDIEIAYLKSLHHKNWIIWWPSDGKPARFVWHIKPPPKPAEGDIQEPSECAYFANGEYVALYNASLNDFYSVKRLSR